MRSTPDGSFRYIMLYRDQRTRFTYLKPLMSEEPKEVANLLIDIFCMMGAPNVLESGTILFGTLKFRRGEIFFHFILAAARR